MSDSPTIPPFVNRTMSFILRSPVHALVSRSVMLITFTGRRSGKLYTTPVSYSREGGVVTLFTHSDWWKNLRGGAPVNLKLRGRDLQGLAEPVTDPDAVAAGLGEHLRRVPSDARYYGVSIDGQGLPRPEEVARGAQSVVMVRVKLC